MAVKKSTLYRSLWESCDQLRGGMDASQYKDYVLAMLFIKYVSDKYVNKEYSEVIVPQVLLLAIWQPSKITLILATKLIKI